jgi:centromeric protein E
MSKLAAPTSFGFNKSNTNTSSANKPTTTATAAATATVPSKLQAPNTNATSTTATSNSKAANDNVAANKENIPTSLSASSSSSTLSLSLLAPSSLLSDVKPRISTGALSGNVIVAVRIRPLNSMELGSGQHSIWNTTDGYTVQHIQNQHQSSLSSSNVGQKPGITDASTRKASKIPSYEFDHVFNDRISNKDIYCVIGESLVDKIVDGYHGCIFAYGQTSSGKTHSIFGNQESPGLITNCVNDIFAAINEASDDREYYLRVSYIEVYNEGMSTMLYSMMCLTVQY